MSLFDQFNDTPFQIDVLGDNATIKLLRNKDGTATVSWVVPDKVDGCCQGPSPYNGILITIDNSPTDATKQPITNIKYESDPTADRSLHMGDKIGTSLVVGYFFDDTSTKSMVITGLDPKETYYVSGFVIDNVVQYHSEGIHTYSLPIGGLKNPNTPASQYIRLGFENGIDLNTSTGLMADQLYTIDMILDNDRNVTFSFSGSDIATYGDLITQWNYKAMLVDNPLISPVLPNSGLYYYQSSIQQLSLWNGSAYSNVPVLVQSTSPIIQSIGNGWIKPDGTFSTWSGSAWSITSYQTNNHAPNELECDDIWYKNGSFYIWSGSAWGSTSGFHQNLNPALPPILPCSYFWFDEDNDQLKEWDDCTNKWTVKLAQYSGTNPATPLVGHLWFNEIANKLYEFDGISYVEKITTISTSNQTILSIASGTYWYNPATSLLFYNNGTSLVARNFLLWMNNPLTQKTNALWWNSTNDTLWQWDSSITDWKPVIGFTISNIDPSKAPILEINTIWTTDLVKFFKWDGSEWNDCYATVSTVDPTLLVNGTHWYDTNFKLFKVLIGGVWVNVPTIASSTNPIVPVTGDFWFNTTNNTLNRFNGTTYVNTVYSTTSLKPNKGFTYFNSSLNKLQTWNGATWLDAEPIFTVSLVDLNRTLYLETSKTGSYARVEVGYSEGASRGYPHVSTIGEFFTKLNPPATPLVPSRGGDGLQSIPSYQQRGPGDDGRPEVRRELIDSIRVQLGYPTIEVELTKHQMNEAITNALEDFRLRSSSAYKTGFKFLKLEPGRQQYPMTDIRLGYNSIINISKLHRVSSQALSQSYGGWAGQGQVILQQLYSAGSYDLISHHLIAQYVEVIEQMFATNITFTWNEDERLLSIFEFVHRPEMVLMECSVERTEQQLMTDRFTKQWIQGRAIVECNMMLSRIRGKFSSLPGAGGGVSLNGAELAQQAQSDLEKLYQELDDFVSNQPELFSNSSMIMG